METPGKRLFYIRKTVLNKSRKYFEKKYSLPETTLRNWEESQNISDKNISIICDILKKEEIACTKVWIKDGQGMSPLDISVNELSKDISRHLSTENEAKSKSGIIKS